MVDFSVFYVYFMYKMSDRDEVEIERERKQFTITKKIAKHGSQAVIIVPRVLENALKPGTIAEIKINVLEGVEE